jgi:WXXGXW repeat (2 copies)
VHKRNLLVAAIVSSTFAALSLPAIAEIDFHVNIAPPAPRYEASPTPRAGYVWAPGYWDYRSSKYVWTKGHWERERKGYYYHPTQWSEYNGKWYRYNGRWDRDNNTNRSRYYDGRSWRTGDRDHDGTPDNRDRQPDNPRRN